MTYRLFLDDERFPAEKDRDMVIVRSYDEALLHIEGEGCPTFISFDHDLCFAHYGGMSTEEKTGYDLAKWLVNKDLEAGGQFLPEDFGFAVHSMNPVGARNIRELLSLHLLRKKSQA